MKSSSLSKLDRQIRSLRRFAVEGVDCYFAHMPHTKNLTKDSLTVSVQLIERRIYLIRGHKVMIDVDLAELYEVPTKRFNQQVRRNLNRFPEDFMFQLTREEADSLRSQFATSKLGPESLRSQIATSKPSQGGRRYLPYAFTEQG